MAYLKGIWVVSGTAQNNDGTYGAFVNIRGEGNDGSVLEGRVSTDETRAMALNFLEVAEAADVDAMIFTLLTRDGGFEAEQAAAFVRKLRDERMAAHRQPASGEPE